MQQGEHYDYVVVGGGSAGCIAAARLSQQTDARVLLLESGPPADDHLETFAADGYKDAFANDGIMAERFSTRQKHAGGQQVYMGSGRVLGGSGSVNGTVYTRGSRQDYDEWPEGWQWPDLAHGFQQIETKLRIHQRSPTRWTEACVQAAERNGFRRKGDLNDGDLADVIGYEWMNYDGEQRRSSYVAFIRDESPRDNLHIRTGANCSRVVFDRARRAKAVEYQWRGQRQVAQVGQEVILSAGALETPKLLMLSGIGPEAHLRQLDIPVVLPAQEVGANLHDHPNVPVFFKTDQEIDCSYPQLYSFHRTNGEPGLSEHQPDTCYVYWPARSAMNQVLQRMLPLKLLPNWLRTNLFKSALRACVKGAFRFEFTQDLVQRLFAIVVILGKPLSRGELRLQSGDPSVPPRIDPRYLEHPRDLQTLTLGVRKAREIAAAMGGWSPVEAMPGVKVRSDRAIARYVAKNLITTYHYAGTCRMGEDDRAVVDSQLRVRGVAGIRVADASVIPSTPVSALNATSMLIGFRVADFICQSR